MPTRGLTMLGLSVISAWLAATTVVAQAPTAAEPVVIPRVASTLEGRPTVRIDSSATETTRRVLGVAESAAHQLVVKTSGGRLLWASQGNAPLSIETSGGYTYLSSAPGRYIRLTRIGARISYVEHLDNAPGHVTFWGELRIVLSR